MKLHVYNSRFPWACKSSCAEGRECFEGPTESAQFEIGHLPGRRVSCILYDVLYYTDILNYTAVVQGGIR